MARTLFRAIAVMSLGLLSGLAFAQDNEPYAADPPERAARLSYISGDVSLQPAGEEQWAPALVNRPLTTGDKLWTERNSRAEIYVGPAAVRLDGATGFSFLNVDDDTIQMRVTAGVTNVSVRRLEGNEHIEIDTPNVALTILRAGSYRVEVNDAGDSTVVKVSEGSVQATGPSQDVVVYAQQVVTFRGTEELIAQHSTLGAPDEFDSWTLDRDLRDERASSSRTAEYVSPDVTGYQDLDNNGTWSSEPEYGHVWTPSYVGVGWAPYRYGRWVWIAPWGYSWIDDAPWGYAPFHYGRWAHVRQRWCWVPGPRHHRAVYAPALVGWGGSPGHNVSWFPLGPREVYVPSHRYSRQYVERVNVANTIVNRMLIADVSDNGVPNLSYRNRAVPGGVTAASRTAFTSAGRIGNQRVRVSEQELASSPASAVAPRIAPERESRMGGPTRANLRRPPQSVVDRQVVVRRDPPSAAARFARSPPTNTNVAQTPERPARPAVRGQLREAPAHSIANDVVVRDRQDRPPRAARPPSESAPPTQSSVYDRRALADRVRVDRDRQVREGQQRESQRVQQRARELIQRQQAPERPVQREHDNQRHRVEQPRVQQPRVQQPRAEQPRAEQPRVPQPREVRPQVERTHRSEPAKPAETKSKSQERSERHSRPSR